MRKYPEGHINRLAEALAKEKVAASVAEAILAGGEEISGHPKPLELSEWFRGALGRMEELLEEPQWRAVRGRCACCLGGKRREQALAICREHATLEERIAASNAAPFVFGHSVERTGDDTVVVSFQPAEWSRYGCPCLREVTAPMPVSYCYCCAGHVRRHLSTALGQDVEVTVLSSALASGGAEACRFECRLG